MFAFHSNDFEMFKHNILLDLLWTVPINWNTHTHNTLLPNIFFKTLLAFFPPIWIETDYTLGAWKVYLTNSLVFSIVILYSISDQELDNNGAAMRFNGWRRVRSKAGFGAHRWSRDCVSCALLLDGCDCDVLSQMGQNSSPRAVPTTVSRRRANTVSKSCLFDSSKASS